MNSPRPQTTEQQPRLANETKAQPSGRPTREPWRTAWDICDRLGKKEGHVKQPAWHAKKTIAKKPGKK